jgi:hypothetical protein
MIPRPAAVRKLSIDNGRNGCELPRYAALFGQATANRRKIQVNE